MNRFHSFPLLKFLRRTSFVILATLLCAHAAASQAWQYGRIVDVHKSVSSRTQAWVVNTPLNEETTTYTISVHLQDRILTGHYQPAANEPAPPSEWIAKYPVQVQVQGDAMYVRGPTGQITFHNLRRKPAATTVALTEEEKKQLAALDESKPQQSLIGFSQDSKAPAKASIPPAPEPPPAPAPAPTTGTITVRSTPYLSEVFVDGDSMGYTPAKINLPPGKHAFRVEKPGYKPWTKELTLTIGSELTLDVNLERR